MVWLRISLFFYPSSFPFFLHFNPFERPTWFDLRLGVGFKDKKRIKLLLSLYIYIFFVVLIYNTIIIIIIIARVGGGGGGRHAAGRDQYNVRAALRCK